MSACSRFMTPPERAARLHHSACASTVCISSAQSSSALGNQGLTDPQMKEGKIRKASFLLSFGLLLPVFILDSPLMSIHILLHCLCECIQDVLKSAYYVCVSFEAKGCWQ